MSDWPTDGNDAHSNKSAGTGSHNRKNVPPPAVSPVLRNWQVVDTIVDSPLNEADASHEQPTNYVDSGFFDGSGVEIEGEATAVELTAETNELSTAVSAADPSRFTDETMPTEHQVTTIADHHDPAIVVSLSERHRQVDPGEEIHYELTILNNGTKASDFRVTVEGWIDEGWLTAPVPQITLDPGAQHVVTLGLAPPRRATTLAGEYQLAFVVREFSTRAEDYGRRMTRLGAMLTILPYMNLRLGRIQPAAIALSWWRKDACVGIPIINHSNHAVAVNLEVRQSPNVCDYAIEIPGKSRQNSANIPPLDESPTYISSTAPMTAVSVVRAGQTIKPTIRIQLRKHPIFAPRKVTAALQVIARAAEQLDATQTPWTRTAAVAVAARPLFGIWHLTSAVGLMTVAIIGASMVGLTALLLFGLSLRQPAPIPQSVAQPLGAPPIIIAYIQAPVNRASGQGDRQIVTGGAAGVPLISQVDVTSPNGIAITTAPTDALPDVVVLPGTGQPDSVSSDSVGTTDGAPPVLVPNQVSAPNVPLSNVTSPVSEVALPVTPAPMTYSTMFREIAHQRDLNWRILAAQAYVESGFDTVALGAQGDLGLMQVLPSTWHEWAPTVNVTDPFDSYSNVLVAATYLDYLHGTLSKRGYPEIEWALVAYNWGIDKVLQHLESGKGWQDLAPARRDYATEILRLAETIPSGG